MKNRTIWELLIIVQTRILEKQAHGTLPRWSGICVAVARLVGTEVITGAESIILYIYIKDFMPQYIRHGGTASEFISAYGWPVGEWDERLIFIEEHIKLNRP